MKIRYSISHQYDDKFAIKYIITVPGKGDLSFISTISYSDFRLTTLVSKAKNVIYSRIFSLRKRGYSLPPQTAIAIEWDGATADLPDSFKRQDFSRPYTPAAPATPAVATSQEPALMEVVKVGDVWTIMVHEQPLLSWDEACKVLKEKILNEGVENED